MDKRTKGDVATADSHPMEKRVRLATFVSVITSRVVSSHGPGSLQEADMTRVAKREKLERTERLRWNTQGYITA